MTAIAMRRTGAVLATLALGLAACKGDGPTGPGPGQGDVALVVAPGALLLDAGATQQLKAYAIDAEGDSTEVSATYESSAPGVVTVNDDGIATGGATLGSAQIVARSGNLVSAPVLALRATPAAGALLVSDAQVIGGIEAVDPAAAYGPGWRYRAHLRGVTPAVGQIVLASGGAPIGGRVVSVSGGGDDVTVVLELIPLGEMFTQLTFSERLSLEHAAVVVPDAARTGFRLGRTATGGIRLQASERKVSYTAGAARPSMNGSAIEQTFDLGPFECKAEVPAGFVFPLTVDVFSFDLDPSLSYDIAFANGVFQRAVVTGGIAPRITASPRLTAALDAKAECKIQLATLHLPIGGPVGLIIGGQVPLGVGFEIGAKTTFGQLGYDALMQASIAASFGIDCAAGCEVVTSLTTTTPGSYFKPVFPSLTDVRFELGVSGFGWAELAIGNGFLQALQFKTVELKAGLEQKLELAGRDAQAADPAYASTFALKPVIEAKAAANLTAIANLLSINLATLTFAPDLGTIAQSPHGTLTITPATVSPGNGTQVGQQATFTVALTDVSYLGAYAVEGVEIRWKKTNGAVVTLAPGRPGCTDLAAAQDQATFSCQTDFLAADAGAQTFYAFVKTRIFGIPIPLPLEIAADAKATVTVGTSQIAVAPTAVTLIPGGQSAFTATITGLANPAVTWSATGGTLNSSGNTTTYTAGNVTGTFAVTATSVADATQVATARVDIVPATAPPGTRVLSADGRMDTVVQLPYTGITPPCDVDLIAPTAIPASLAYSATLECPPMSQVDPQGDSHTGRSESRQSYSVATTDGTLAGDVISIEIDGGSTASSAATANHTVSAEGSSRMAVCFSVPAGATYHWRVTGTLSAAGKSGYASASLTGTSFLRNTSATLPSTLTIDDTGPLTAGNHCLSVVQVATANSGVANASASADSRYTTVKVQILP